MGRSLTSRPLLLEEETLTVRQSGVINQNKEHRRNNGEREMSFPAKPPENSLSVERDVHGDVIPLHPTLDARESACLPFYGSMSSLPLLSL